MEATVKERLVSADSHVHFTDEWVKAHMPSRLHAIWDNAVQADQKFQAEVLRQGQRNLDVNDFVDMEAASDPGHFEPLAKLQAMDRDGVEAEVIFPEVGASKLCNPKYMGGDWKEVLQYYNDGMADFASTDVNRLLTAYQLQLFDVPFCVAEVQRLAQKGARCVQIPPFPAALGLPDVHDPRYAPLWSALEETGITVLNHLDLKDSLWDVFRRDPTPQKGIFTFMPACSLGESMMFWVLTGTLERHPKLKVIFVEPGLGWLPWYFEQLDHRMHQHYQFPGLKLLPSEYFKRQMGATFMWEPGGLGAAYQAFGADCLYWSTDFPHPATCWPNSQAQVKEQFAAAGIPDADRAKIVRENAIRTFGLA
jgi:predicted TIM-barrel fold metal-dependent hydrolase